MSTRETRKYPNGQPLVMSTNRNTKSPNGQPLVISAKWRNGNLPIINLTNNDREEKPKTQRYVLPVIVNQVRHENPYYSNMPNRSMENSQYNAFKTDILKTDKGQLSVLCRSPKHLK